MFSRNMVFIATGHINVSTLCYEHDDNLSVCLSITLMDCDNVVQ